MKIEHFNTLPEMAMQIRQDVFVTEQGFVDEFDEVDARAIHFLMTEGEKPVATCRVFTEENPKVYFLGRLAVEKEYRGKHVGSKMLQAILEYVQEVGGAEIRLHSQLQAKEFYTSNGYEPYSEIEDEQGCPHIWMRKKL